ncbi:MAG TPA: hypothetical protein VFF57_04270, partial [Hanamia sp.]|nr:hypothetical protein [Hanamia sp.]
KKSRSHIFYLKNKNTGCLFAIYNRLILWKLILTIKFYTMTLFGFLILLLIAAICGGIGQSIAGYNVGGCLVSIVVGFIGAYIGLWVAAKLGLPDFFTVNVEGKPFPIIWAIIGSAIFTFFVALLRRAFTGRD